MKRFLIFVLALFLFGTANADEYTLLCSAGYRLNGDFCEICPAGTFSHGGDATECTPCPRGTYSDTAGAVGCVACRADYPNTDPGAASPNECYSDVKLREYDGTVECRNAPDGCTSSTCSICESEPEPCEYVAYLNKVKKGLSYVYVDGEIKSGCATNPCLSDTIDYILLDGGAYDSESNKCELCAPGMEYSVNPMTGAGSCDTCPAGTYKSGYGAGSCNQCPTGTYSNAGAGECMPCPANTYNDTTGATTCTPCPDGMVSKPGTTGVSQCVAVICDAGYYIDNGKCEICPAGTYSTGDNATECTPCNAGYISEPGADKCVAACAAGMYYVADGDAYKCEPCPKNTYSNSGATECTPCPASHPNSDGGTNVCYTDELERPWTGHQVCDTPSECFDAVCAPCEIKPCKYIETRVKKGLLVEKKIIGCEINNANCSTPVTAVAAPGWHTIGAQRCEQCPAGTYSTGGENAQCVPCPQNKSASMPGATSSDECGRILNYRAPNATTATQIFLGTIKNTSPALAVGIGDDVFYANMTAVTDKSEPGMYIGYDNKTYVVASNDIAHNIAYKSEFYITTTPDTDNFNLYINSTGNFSIDWGDGNVEMVKYETCARNKISHTYDAPGEYKISLGGKAAGYCKVRMGLTYVYYSIEFTDKLKIAGIDGSLGAVFPTLHDGTNPNFAKLFSGSTNLTGQIPDDLFAGIAGSPSKNIKPSGYMFDSVFSGCSGLTGKIPVGLFGKLSGAPGGATFTNAFYGCSGLTGPMARNFDGTPLYDIEYDGKTWYEQSPATFTDMYTNSGISDF